MMSPEINSGNLGVLFNRLQENERVCHTATQLTVVKAEKRIHPAYLHSAISRKLVLKKEASKLVPPQFLQVLRLEFAVFSTISFCLRVLEYNQ
ncbi:hypothetical protein STEG23_038316, partial [Scotinomys teguina]